MLSRLKRQAEVWRLRRAEAAHVELRPARERERWEAVLLHRSDHPKALRRAAELAGLAGDPDRAEDLWTRALTLPALEAQAHGQLARRALDRGDLAAARSHADHFLARTKPEPRAFSLRRQIESLRAHLDDNPTRAAPRHLCVTGVAFSGSTLVGHLLGGLPGASNIGESHWLIHRRIGWQGVDIDFDADRDEALSYCNSCGPTCPIWTWEARRALSLDRRDWFRRIGEQLGAQTLVSTDKNQLKHLTLDPWLRFDALVLFRHPRHAWKSAARPGRKPRSVDAYLRRWDDEYRKLAFDLPNRGAKVFLDLDAFRKDPDRHLERLQRTLALPSRDSQLDAAPDHSIGGNGRVVTAFREDPDVKIVTEQVEALPPEEARFIEVYAQHSEVYAFLRRQHTEFFDEPGER
ncbi:MAG: hypothetical protein GY937_01550 [bacterium]|nr:hypothetical protein [bacterium]